MTESRDSMRIICKLLSIAIFFFMNQSIEMDILEPIELVI